MARKAAAGRSTRKNYEGNLKEAEVSHQNLTLARAKLEILKSQRGNETKAIEKIIEALAIVIELIESDTVSFEKNIAGPLKQIQSILHDINQGAKPALIFARPRLAGKPTNTVSDGMRGLLAAAVQVLITAGVPREEAGQFVATQAVSNGVQISGLSRKVITAARVLRWRDEYKVASSEAFSSAYKAILELVHAAEVERNATTSRSAAEELVACIIKSHANYGPSDQDSV